MEVSLIYLKCLPVTKNSMYLLLSLSKENCISEPKLNGKYFRQNHLLIKYSLGDLKSFLGNFLTTEQYAGLPRVDLILLQWRHNERDGVSNHQPHYCLLGRIFKAHIKEDIKSLCHWPLCREFTGDRWISRLKGQWRGKCFHLMMYSCVLCAANMITCTVIT